MGILKENYEKFILSIVLFAAIFGLIDRLGMNRIEVEPLDLSNNNQYKIDVSNWNHIKYNSSGYKILLNDDGNVFSFDEVVFCPYDDCHNIVSSDSPRCIFCSRFILKDTSKVSFTEDVDADGLSNRQEIEFKMNPFSKKDILSDNDADGFSNIIEFNERFDINDSNDHPPLVWGLSFLKITRPFLNIVLKTIYTEGKSNKEEWEASILVAGRTKYLKLGDEVGKGYKIVDMKNDNYIDESGKNIIKIVVFFKRGDEETFAVYPKQRVYPPKSLKYYFLYENGGKSKSMIVQEGDDLVLSHNNNTESYQIFKYVHEHKIVILIKDKQYYSVKIRSILSEMREGAIISSSPEESTEIIQRTTL